MKILADNRKANFDYFVEDKFEAGMVLEGSEIKSVRSGKINLKDSYVIIKNEEAFLIGAHISPYDNASGFDKLDPLRTRKLLFSKSELAKLQKKVLVKGYTLIPLDVHLSHGYAKINVAVAKGKQNYNKKDAIKERDISRETAREIRG